MDINKINAYETRNAITDNELLDMLYSCSTSIIEDVQALRVTGTEVESIKRIQESLVVMCSAIQVFAPDMMNIDYSTESSERIYKWKLVREETYETICGNA